VAAVSLSLCKNLGSLLACRRWSLLLHHPTTISTITKYVYIKSTTVYVPSSELGLSQPLSRQRVFPSLQNRGVGGGHIRLRVRGRGTPNSDDLRKSLALCLLCVHNHREPKRCIGHVVSVLPTFRVAGLYRLTIYTTIECTEVISYIVKHLHSMSHILSITPPFIYPQLPSAETHK
jgi:hypothetical protein